LGSLYDHIMDGLLKPQPESSHDENVKSHDEDVEMDEEDENVISTGTRQPRIVSREEIDTFTELFRKHSIRPPPQSHTNGHPDAIKKAKTNSVRPPTSAANTPMHGSVHKQKNLRVDEGIASPGPVPGLSINGKKRKKVSD